MTSPERFATRTFLPSASILKPTRDGLPSLGSSSARFDRWIGASLETIPASGSRSGASMPAHHVDAAHERAHLLRAHLDHLAVLALVAAGADDDVVALLDLERHHRTSGIQADDLHVVPGPELARDRPEDARADRLALRVDEHGGVAVEADERAVGRRTPLAVRTTTAFITCPFFALPGSPPSPTRRWCRRWWRTCASTRRAP